MAGKAPGSEQKPDHRVTFEPCAKRIRVLFAGETIADSTDALLLRETGHTPVYYFPWENVRKDLLIPSDRRTYCPFKGAASYCTVQVSGRSAEDAVWTYEDPYDEVAGIAGYMAFYWDRMDKWMEEDEEVFVHARDPYTRIDILKSKRPVRILAGGEVVAESERAVFLFETGLPVRYYLPRGDVRMDLLVPSETVSRCPYKGTASYWSLAAGGYEDIAWCYSKPVRESARIRDRICFFNERVDEISVGGVPVAKPTTKWSRIRSRHPRGR
jgi:uncharacterized protein (DUF427 family)